LVSKKESNKARQCLQPLTEMSTRNISWG